MRSATLFVNAVSPLSNISGWALELWDTYTVPAPAAPRPCSWAMVATVLVKAK